MKNGINGIVLVIEDHKNKKKNIRGYKKLCLNITI